MLEADNGQIKIQSQLRAPCQALPKPSNDTRHHAIQGHPAAVEGTQATRVRLDRALARCRQRSSSHRLLAVYPRPPALPAAVLVQRARRNDKKLCRKRTENPAAWRRSPKLGCFPRITCFFGSRAPYPSFSSPPPFSSSSSSSSCCCCCCCRRRCCCCCCCVPFLLFSRDPGRSARPRRCCSCFAFRDGD